VQVIATVLPSRKDAHDVVWVAILALNGAMVNAQTGGQSTAAALDGLHVVLEALTKGAPSDRRERAAHLSASTSAAHRVMHSAQGSWLRGDLNLRPKS
jgi:type II secretory pathway component PulL